MGYVYDLIKYFCLITILVLIITSNVKMLTVELFYPPGHKNEHAIRERDEMQHK